MEASVFQRIRFLTTHTHIIENDSKRYVKHDNDSKWCVTADNDSKWCASVCRKYRIYRIRIIVGGQRHCDYTIQGNKSYNCNPI